MSMWDKVQATVKKTGEKAGVAAHKAKLRTDMLFIDREILSRKKKFGIAMYDHISPLSQSQDFYAANDDLTNMVRPHLINAQKEISALAAKRVKLKESLAQQEASRAAAFPVKAETYGGKLMNLGKAGGMHSIETKIKAELAILEQKIKGYKQSFGIVLFEEFVKAEDSRGYLPSDRQVRSIYDTCRGDIQQLEQNKQQKSLELHSWGGGSSGTGPEDGTTMPSVVEHSEGGYGSNGGMTTTTNHSTYTAPSTTASNGGTAGPSDAEDLLL